jgi:predicted dehydrogenase
MDQVRWGIIGVGNVTEAKSGPGFQRADRSSLVAVMRRNGEAAADYARRHGVPQWYDDADALIGDPEVNAVYVATPPDSHRDYAIRALMAGKPVYVEKPMARTGAECQQMIDVAQQTGLPLFVAYYRRAMPRFVTVAKLIKDGALGEVQAFTIRNQRPADATDGPLPWRLQPEIAGGGHFVDLGSHTLDLIDHLLGPIVEVNSSATRRADQPPTGMTPAEDLVAATFQLDSGVTGTGLWCYAAGVALDEVEIIGSTGSLAFSCFGQEPLRLRTAAGEQQIDAPYPEVVQQPLIQLVVDELTGRGSAPSTATSAIRTARVIDAVLADYRDQRGITFS